MSVVRSICCAALLICVASQSLQAQQQYLGPTTTRLAENDGYYARFSGESFKYMNWDAARLYASNLYITRNGKRYVGFLYTPNTPSENAFVVANLGVNEDWIGLFQAPRATSPASNWWLLNNRPIAYNGWGSGEPDDQKNGAWTRCRILSFFNGVKYTSDGDSSSFEITQNTSAETGCENCGMIRADGKWKDKECNSHGNGFIVEFRSL